MPELPDVQVFKEYVDATCLHQEIEGVHLKDADRLLKEVSSTTLRRNLKGGRFQGTRRHGKYLFLEVEDEGVLVLHFGMTGFVRYFKAGEGDPPDHSRLTLDFRGGHRMAYVNTRKLGELDWARDVTSFVEDRGLGPDALDVDPQEFQKMLEGRRGTLKGTLMNQGLIAGLGNVYSDEILFRSGLHPRRTAGDLGGGTAASLHEDMHHVLKKAIQGRVEEFPPDFLLPHREGGAECPRCGGTIRKIRVSGRPTYFCEDHQNSQI